MGKMFRSIVSLLATLLAMSAAPGLGVAQSQPPTAYVTSVKDFKNQGSIGKRNATDAVAAYQSLKEADAAAFQGELDKLEAHLAAVKSTAGKRITMLNKADENKAALAALNGLMSVVNSAQAAATRLKHGSDYAPLGTLLTDLRGRSTDLALLEPMDWALIAK